MRSMIDLVCVILKKNEDKILAADRANLGMVISRDVVQKTMGDKESLKDVMRLLNEQLQAEDMLFFNWIK